MGVNYVEREGISYSHPAEFILIGTMNPEEGDLRPQLLVQQEQLRMSPDVAGGQINTYVRLCAWVGGWMAVRVCV